MARSRRGSFGLQPRVVPNITAQIVALAREYEAKRDANIMDAWRNGGTFEGKKATDEMVLAYWRGKMEGLDSGDPNYEEAKNNIMQLQYAIEQSKQDLLHLQGRISDTAYAQFFLKWAKKVPKNSEFYRVLQKDAAQLIESAKAKARANAERARVESFNKFVATTTKNDIAIGDAMTKALTDLSKRTGLSVTGNGVELLALLTQDVRDNPDSYRALLDTIKRGDPDWDGKLTEGYFTKHLDSAVDGYSKIADRAMKQGYVSAYNQATEGMSSMSAWGQNVDVWPVAKSYTAITSKMDAIWNDPTASQMDKVSAAGKAAEEYDRLAKSPGIDAGTREMLEADAARLRGQDAGDTPSFGEFMLGRAGVSPEKAMVVGSLLQTKMAYEANPTAWAYAPVDKNGMFDTTGMGALGWVPAGSIPPGAQQIMVPGLNGQAVMGFAVPHDVYTVDPNNPNGTPKLAGQTLNYNIGGRNVTLWGYKDERGEAHWTIQSPLADGTTTQMDPKGNVYVTPPKAVVPDPIAVAANLQVKLPDGTNKDLRAEGALLAKQMQQASTLETGESPVITTKVPDANGKILGSVELSWKDGAFHAVFVDNTMDAQGRITQTIKTPLVISDPKAKTYAYSPSLLSAGNVPGVTFSSPMQASIHASVYTQTQDQVGKYASDPAMQQAFLKQTMDTLGTDNPFDPRIAAAWNDVVTPKNVAGLPEYRTPMSAALRDDLKYPGAVTNPDAYKGQLTVNFGTQGELRLPGLPSYLGTQNKWDFDAFAKAAAMQRMSALLPGLGTATPPQQPTGTPNAVAPTPTPPPTVAPPTPLPKPTAPPAPVPTPTPPPGSPGSGPYDDLMKVK